jgi:hypothetical protein
MVKLQLAAHGHAAPDKPAPLSYTRQVLVCARSQVNAEPSCPNHPSMSDDIRPPIPSTRDRVIKLGQAAAKGTVGALPFAGSLIAEILNVLFKDPADLRRQDWMESVADAVDEIRRKQEDLTLEKLGQNEEFVSMLHRATDVAVRTHERTKRAALRNAVVNAAMPTAPDIDLQSYFLRLVDELNSNQILILNLYDDPAGWFRLHRKDPPDSLVGSRLAVLNAAYPDLAAYPRLRELHINDLERRGLIGGLSGMVSGGAVLDRMTSTLAHEFIRYIETDERPLALSSPT